ncbi:MAG TPA: undecaprenyl-diphosphate phosphatase [Methylomirabilota bacterium]|jgi:undecaprenyl-diphosphatase|nr:undecaprenyl-diphosphate phosphatase [Methylomirabilota bacterium]
MHFIQAIILGIVEGVTEFLPISSTGHLILVSRLLNLTSSDFVKSFEIIIQLGAILAVVILYFKRIIFSLEVIKRLIIAFIPTGIIGLIFYKLVKDLLGNNQVVLWSLFLGGLVLIIFEWLHKEKISDTEELTKITYKQAFLVGCFQAVAIVPGVSRAAATIVGGMLMGIKRRTIVEFSFMLAIPTMAAATGLDLIKNYHVIFSSSLDLLLVGFVTAFIVALFSIKFFLKYIQKHSFRAFGVYRIIIAIIFWFIV